MDFNLIGADLMIHPRMPLLNLGRITSFLTRMAKKLKYDLILYAYVGDEYRENNQIMH
jgi:hypothetical protein